MTELSFDVSQVRKLKRELKRVRGDSPELAKRLGQASKAGGQVIVDDAGRRLSGLGRQQALAAKGIKPSAVPGKLGIRLRLANSSRVPFALAAVLGQQRRSGWYGLRRYRNSAGRQFPRWVGNSWEPGGPGGPLGLNPAIRHNLDDVVEEWGDEVVALMEELNIR